MPYECHARPGAGNFEILNRLIDQLQSDDPAMFVINWSYIDRFSYIRKIKQPSRYSYYNPQGWDSLLPVDTDTKTETYYKEIHTQMRDRLETLICIKFAIDNLKIANRRFIMTYIDPLILEENFQESQSIKWLQSQIRPYLEDFEGMNFLDWSRSKGFPISSSQHPLEPAHEAAADHILAHWDNYIKL